MIITPTFIAVSRATKVIRGLEPSYEERLSCGYSAVVISVPKGPTGELERACSDRVKGNDYTERVQV